jgi:hypothetical protein
MTKKTYRHRTAGENTHPHSGQRLTAISTLWSFRVRKTGSDDVNILGQDLIEVMVDILSAASFTGSESKGLEGMLLRIGHGT